VIPHCYPCETTEMVPHHLSTDQLKYYQCPKCGHVVVIFGEKLLAQITKLATKCDSRWTRGDQETWIKRDDDPDYTPSTYTTNADDKDDEEMAGLGALFG